MFKLIICTSFLVLAAAAPAPAPEAKPDAHLGLVAAAYTVPPVASAPIAYPAAYSSPIAYSSYVVPSVYAAYYAAYGLPVVV